jgi:hypothetical protein
MQSTARHRYSPDTSNKERLEELSQSDLEVIDGSEAIFAMYLEMALREDKEMVEGWKEDANTILIFVSSSLRL